MAKNKKKDKVVKFFAIVSIILCVCAFALGFVVTQQDDAYYNLEKSRTVEISSEDDIIALGDSIYNDSCILTADIHITDSALRIGTSERSFSGTFDGNGHTVYIDYTSVSQDVSLFGCIEADGVVKNTRFVFGNIAVEGNTYGGIARINYGIIKDCKIECSNILIDNNSGIYSPCVTTNMGTISNIVVECAFSNAQIYENESSILFGAVCTYNYGTVTNSISSPSFSNLDCCDEFKILTGETTNVGVGAICAVTTAEGSTANSVAVLPSGVYTSDKNSGLKVVESLAEVLKEDTIFFELDFSNQVWKIQGDGLMLIEG